MIFRSGSAREPQPVPAGRATLPAPTLDPTPETLLIEQKARNAEAAAMVENILYAQGRRPAELRNGDLVDLCLDLRSALRPKPAGSQTPVIPGRPR